ncbi:MYND-type domain-containing protein [Mycena venus]|uniref:MYND-type domain-containing protein n=1 Tax=Mycena venus TaxID=2733690 RepID=A0A8H6Y9E9_9AGAR|nr:MYND-type domain-containing protein [Mycena venus]
MSITTKGRDCEGGSRERVSDMKRRRLMQGLGVHGTLLVYASRHSSWSSSSVVMVKARNRRFDPLSQPPCLVSFLPTTTGSAPPSIWTADFEFRTSMHVSLRMSRLAELPHNIQEVATAAANGSFQDFKRLRKMIFIEKSHSHDAVLPVIYRCLDPQKIPTVDEAAPRHAVSLAALALKTLFIPIIPAGAGSDLWPRAWAWFRFLDTHRPKMTEMKGVLVKCACRLPPEERSRILNAEQGFYTVVGRVLASLADGTDVELARFVLALLATVDISNLDDLVEGVGGSFESLANLTVRHLVLTEDTPITELRLDLLRYFLVFATRLAKMADIDSDPPDSARCSAKAIAEVAVKPLMDTLCLLSLTTEPDPEPVIDKGFSFLLQVLCSMPKMYFVLPAAIDTGLIKAISLCGRPSLSKTHHNLRTLLLDHLSPSTIYYEVLGRFSDVLQNVHCMEMFEVLTDAPDLMTPDIAKLWAHFLMLVSDRTEILWKVVPNKMCDNLACSKKDAKDTFQMCSKCKHCYYCSKECQSTDWHAGSHKTACSVYRYGEHTLTERRHLTKRDRDFMRAALDHNFSKYKHQIYDQTIKCIIAHPDAGWFVVFDYVSTPFAFEVHSLAVESSVLEKLRKSGLEWEVTVARAARSQGRMTIHVMRAYEGKEGRYWVLPLRSTTGEVHERLRRFAAVCAAGGDVSNFMRVDTSAWDVDAIH